MTADHRRYPVAAAMLLAQALAMCDAASAQTAVAPQPASSAAVAAGTAQTQGPHFASLRSDRVHLRQGPGTDHKVLWIYKRAGMPIEVLKEFEGWRQVRDSEGATGWVSQALVSNRRTALVLPWEVKDGNPPQVALLSDDKETAGKVALVEAGVIANIRSCDGRWCHVSIGEFRGYIQQKKLWGVYENETLR